MGIHCGVVCRKRHREVESGLATAASSVWPESCPSRTIHPSRPYLRRHRRRLFSVGPGELPDMMYANFRTFRPPPPCPHLNLIYAIKFMQPPLLHSFIPDPLPLLCGHHIWKLPCLAAMQHAAAAQEWYFKVSELNC